VICEAWGALSLTGAPTWWLPRVDLALADHVKCALRFSHSVAFLACAWADAPPSSRPAAITGLLQQFASRHRGLRPCIEDATPADGAIHDCVNTWLGPRVLQDPRALPCSSCPTLGSPLAATTTAAVKAEAWASPEGPPAALITTAAVRSGRPLFALRAERVPATWPVDQLGPFGSVLTGGIEPANMRWSSVKCSDCGAQVLTAIATEDIPAGAPLRGSDPPGVAACRPANAEWQVSFDGGARDHFGDVRLPMRAAGAGAALWGPVGQGGVRPCLAQACLSLPACSNSVVAEATGLRLGIALLRAARPTPTSVLTMGDNLGVLRTAGAFGRSRTDGVWVAIERPVTYLACNGWQSGWAGVRRQFNKLADRLATRATNSSVLAAAGGRPGCLRLWGSPCASLASPLVSEWFPDTTVSCCDAPLWRLDSSG